jgi:hypothetical protein
VVNPPVVGKPALSTNYDTTLDLRNYKYPTLDILETHGSEKIIHDPAELEAHKNQIVSTLMNYDIAIQRIAATVGRPCRRTHAQCFARGFPGRGHRRGAAGMTRDQKKPIMYLTEYSMEAIFLHALGC